MSIMYAYLDIVNFWNEELPDHADHARAELFRNQFPTRLSARPTGSGLLHVANPSRLEDVNGRFAGELHWARAIGATLRLYAE